MEERIVRPGFNKRVYDAVRRIPAGRVSTYGDVATVLGSPRVARQVGFALAALQDPDVPWHRVINAQGRISHRGDVARAEEQKRRLEAEGQVFDADGRLDLDGVRWDWPDAR
jgi:methylated-DNA-protein-cysteine methyltransferase-like protein